MSEARSPLPVRALLDEIEALARELHPDRPPRPLSLESVLDRDAGIDSLGRVELLARLERRFGVSLPDGVVAGAERIGDLLPALAGGAPAAEGPAAEPPAVAPVEAEATGQFPERAGTLVEVLEWHAERHPDRPHLRLYGEDGQWQVLTYGDLLRESGEVAAGLVERDVAPGRPVGLMLQTCRDFFRGFFGILRAGGVPVPLYPPQRASQIEEHVRRQAGILSNAQAPLLLTSAEVLRVGRMLKTLVPELREAATVEEVARPGARPPRGKPAPGDLALLQYTSGSTGAPKGVVLTHANLLANIRALREASGANDADVFVSWLPLYHDMGLIGAWLGSLYVGIRAVLMSPRAFLARPPRWLRTIHRERGTISAAPNFAYELCAARIPDSELEGLDLSCWRLALNGAEMVHAGTIERFCARFARYGFRREAMVPVYGLAENSLGLTFPPPGRGPRVDRIRREEFGREGAARPAEPGDARALEFVCCGAPLPGHEIRIVDETGREVGERVRGRLQFRGPSATTGYYRNREATRALIREGWVDSGDYAYVAEGEVYPCGRAKDLIIKGGRNIHPQELEEVVGEIPGIRRGNVAVFGVPDPSTGTERLVVLAETREESPEGRRRLVEAIQAAAADLLGMPADDVVLAPPRTVPKTPSGKIRRSACRELYEEGRLGEGPPSPLAQWARLAAAGAGPLGRRLGRALRDLLYAQYARILFLGAAVLVWPLVVLLPGVARRRALVREACRAVLRLAGIRVSVSGLGRIPPEGPCVLVANHASYIDPMVLSAVLPPEYAYVVKRDVAGGFVPRLFLRALGSISVERFDPSRGTRDVAHLERSVRKGGRVVIFAEGTFGRAPGLRPFRMGAFVVAVRAGAPVVPVALRGTRAILRDVEWHPRRGAVEVSVAEPLFPDGADWAAALRLRDRARAAVLAGCGEPDLRER